MKSIETTYNGVAFRSRTEARWAVFFDVAGIPWRYEPEGFEFDGERYVPDFWLPREQAYLEVKGEMPGDDTLRRLYRFSKKSGKTLLIAIGAPEMNTAVATISSLFEEDFSGDMGCLWGWLVEDRKDENIICLMNDAMNETPSRSSYGFCTQITPGNGSDKWPVACGRIADAYERAAKHRFDWLAPVSEQAQNARL